MGVGAAVHDGQADHLAFPYHQRRHARVDGAIHGVRVLRHALQEPELAIEHHRVVAVEPGWRRGAGPAVGEQIEDRPVGEGRGAWAGGAGRPQDQTAAGPHRSASTGEVTGSSAGAARSMSTRSAAAPGVSVPTSPASPSDAAA